MVSQLISFVVGVFAGAAGKYLADKFTDQRRRRESNEERKKDFRLVQGRMPDLIAEMKRDLEDPERQFIREFFVVPNRHVIVNNEIPRLVYFEDEHQDLRNKLLMLENRRLYDGCYAR